MEKYHLRAASILSQGALMGCVMLLGEEDSPLQEADQGLARATAGVLGMRLES